MATITEKDMKNIKDSDEQESEVDESDVEESDVEESEAEDEDKDVAAEEEASEAEASEAEASEAEEESEASEAEEKLEASEAEEEGASEAEEEGTKKKKTRGQKKTGKKIVSQIEGIEKLEASKKGTITQYDSDDNEEDEANYLQKFDSKMRENFITDHHPEARTHNYEEVKALCRVSRDGRGIIIDPLHKTIPFLTKYEMTRVIGQRAKQLDSGAKAFVKVPINVIDGYHIALLELEQKKLPFIIKRPYPNGGVEYWNVSDLEVLI
jgi:DNA-directed RNA polymerase subunit K/omega